MPEETPRKEFPLLPSTVYVVLQYCFHDMTITYAPLAPAGIADIDRLKKAMITYLATRFGARHVHLDITADELIKFLGDQPFDRPEIMVSNDGMVCTYREHLYKITPYLFAGASRRLMPTDKQRSSDIVAGLQGITGDGMTPEELGVAWPSGEEPKIEIAPKGEEDKQMSGEEKPEGVPRPEGLDNLLEFLITNLEVAPVEDPPPSPYTPIENRMFPDGPKWVYKFENGYGASIVRNAMSEGRLNLIVLKWEGDQREICYDTPFIDDTVYLSEDEVAGYLTQIASFPVAGDPSD
jgi:hypothetical protein